MLDHYQMVAMYEDVFFHSVKLNRLKNLSHKSFLKPGIGVHCATIFDQKYRHSGSKSTKGFSMFASQRFWTISSRSNSSEVVN